MSNDKKYTVEEFFEINEDDLLDKTEDHENRYWNSCFNFYMDNKDKDVELLTPKQMDWLQKIEEDLR